MEYFAIENEKQQKNKIENFDEILDKLTLFDDDLMSRVFAHNIKATELFLSIILQEKIRVISVIGQEQRKNPIFGGRNIVLDVHAMEENGQEIDIEVQSNVKGSDVKEFLCHFYV